MNVRTFKMPNQTYEPDHNVVFFVWKFACLFVLFYFLFVFVLKVPNWIAVF